MRGLRQPTSNLSPRACIQGGVSWRNHAYNVLFLKDRFYEQVVAKESLNTFSNIRLLKSFVSKKLFGLLSVNETSYECSGATMPRGRQFVI